jgi:hypothetical protein
MPLEPPARTHAAEPSVVESSKDARPAESSLWELLTPEERAFFARAAELGPLTYRPGGRTSLGASLPTGQRIDLRG